jgi:hypothetical protein
MLFVLLFGPSIIAQENAGSFSGSFEGNANLFLTDEDIGATNLPQYDNELIGSEAWLNLQYSNYGFDIGLRFDVFQNSNLLNPNGSYSDQGIGRWFIKKKIHGLEITGGYFYDQIGSGVIFRAFEQRPLLIDNALYGIRLAYDLPSDFVLKAFRGKQKKQFDIYDPDITGVNLDGFIPINEEKGISIAPGIGFVIRTFGEENINEIVSVIATYEPEDQFSPKYNTYAGSIYNTLTAGPFTWYLEAALKGDDTFFDPEAPRKRALGGVSKGKLVFDSGSVIYSSLSYADHGFGISLEVKRTENFSFRTDIFDTTPQGVINFLPPMFRENTYRLTARYSPITQELGEFAYQIDLRYAPSRKLNFNVNFARITDLDDLLLYQEIYGEFQYKYKRKWQLLGGLQLQRYNQEFLEGKTDKPMVETVTPFVEFLYKFTRKKSLRLELQYMNTEQDFGSWIFGLVELGIAPHWIFEVSTMYNSSPNPDNTSIPVDDQGNQIEQNFTTLGVTYTKKSNRFSLRYVEQVEGIVCSGGVCRLEPAFSGVRFAFTSLF